MEILNMDQLKAVLDRLAKIEIDAIGILAVFRGPDKTDDIFCHYSTILLNILIRIRDFRTLLSKNNGEWDFAEYEEFLRFSASAMDHCNQAAMQMYHNSYRQ